jgi:hypothetical protein
MERLIVNYYPLSTPRNVIDLRSYGQILEVLSHGKLRGKKSFTNFYLGQNVLENYLAKESLMGFQLEGAAIVIRRDRDFFHLYTQFHDPESFGNLLFHLPPQETYVADLIGRDGSQVQPVTHFEKNGFYRHQQLVRYSMNYTPITFSHEKSQCFFVTEKYSEQVLNYLDNHFDRFSEQLPDIDDVKFAAQNKQILGVLRDDVLVGFLFFELSGLVSTVRYWFVHPEYRDENIGGELMKSYLAVSSSITKSNLWVVSENLNAIKRYLHYGYEAESLTDQVLIFRS